MPSALLQILQSRAPHEPLQKPAGAEDDGQCVAWQEHCNWAAPHVCMAHVQEIQKSALEALTDLLLQQLAELGEASHGHANLAGRTDRNINDVVSMPPPSPSLPPPSSSC